MNLTKFLRYTPESWSQFTCLNSSHSSKTDRKSVCYRTFSDQGSQRRFVSLLSGSLGTMDFGGDLTTLQNRVFWMTETMLFLLLQISWGPFPLRKSHHQFMSRNQKSLVVKGGKAKDCGRCQFSPRITKEALCIVRAATREHHRLATLNNRNVFSHRAGGKTCRQGWFLPRPLSLACRWATFSLCPRMAFSLLVHLLSRTRHVG